jgi:hypothetical protein
MTSRRALFFGVCAFIVIVVSTLFCLIHLPCFTYGCLEMRMTAREEKASRDRLPMQSEACDVQEAPPVRADVKEMLEFAKLAKERLPTQTQRIFAEYDAKFKDRLNHHQGDPSFTWYEVFHHLDPEGTVLRSYVESRSCVWKTEAEYYRRMAQIRVSPRTLEEVKVKGC